MSTLQRLIILLIPVFGISSCASITVEDQLIPFLTPWDGEVDTVQYRYSELNKILDMGGALISIGTDYQVSSYRGLYILGVESHEEGHWPQTNENIFALKVGVRASKSLKEYYFSPYQVSVSRYMEPSEKVFKPFMVYKTERNRACSLEYSFIDDTWGADSEHLNNTTLMIRNYQTDSKFDCFVLVYDLNKNNLDGASINFEQSLLPIADSHLYLQRKTIKWISAN